MKLNLAAVFLLIGTTVAGCALSPIKTGNTATTPKPVVRPVIASTASTAEQLASEKASLDQNQTTQKDRSSHKRKSRPATQALREQADTASQKDDLLTANRLLERALRIDPRDAATYLALARLRKQQNQSAAAEQLIDKGLSLRPNAQLKAQLEELGESIKDQ